jgi:small subunit ribosomal protein S16
VATKIKLMRLGKMRAPYYRIVVADARNKRDGRSIEEIGKYHPKDDPSFIEVDSERAQYWLGVGAQPTEAVAAIFRVTGDWQKFKGEPAPEPMKVAAPKDDKHVAFASAAAESAGVEESPAPTPKAKKAPKKAAATGDAASAPADAAAAPSAEPAAAPSAEPAAETPPETVAETPAETVGETTPAADEATTAAAEAAATTPGA